MNTLILIISILCFVNGIWWVISDLKAPLVFKIILRIIGVASVALPVMYWININ